MFSLGQGKYAVEILKSFRMMDCKAMTTPMESNLKLLSVSSSESVDATMYRQMIGSLMYLTNTRPDIFFAMNTLRHVHLIVAKGTVEYGLKYDMNKNINLDYYMDSYWVDSSIDRKSTLGCFFSMGSGVISWFSRKQSRVALSIAEAEYAATCSTSCEEVWLRKLLSDLFYLPMDGTCIY